jgi:hypothetical protein
MSLAINPDRVFGVLLADGWHEVQQGSFYFDAYEFVDEDGDPVLSGGSVPGVPATGASWIDPKHTAVTGIVRFYCPVTSILAVKELVPQVVREYCAATPEKMIR